MAHPDHQRDDIERDQRRHVDSTGAVSKTGDQDKSHGEPGTGSGKREKDDPAFAPESGDKPPASDFPVVVQPAHVRIGKHEPERITVTIENGGDIRVERLERPVPRIEELHVSGALELDQPGARDVEPAQDALHLLGGGARRRHA